MVPGEKTDESTEQQEVGTSVDTQSTQIEQEDPRLLAGKYKTLEELEKAYEASEAKMHEATTEKSKAIEEAAEANRIAQQWADYYRSQNVEQEDDDAVMDRSAVRRESTQAAQQFYAMARRSEANIKRELGKLKGEKMFGKVSSEVEAALLEIDPSITSNAQAMPTIAQNIFNLKIGEYYRTESETARSDPKKRREFLDEIGVSEPSPSQPNSSEDSDLPSDGKELLSQIGLSKDAMKRVQQRVAARGDE